VTRTHIHEAVIVPCLPPKRVIMVALLTHRSRAGAAARIPRDTCFRVWNGGGDELMGGGRGHRGLCLLGLVDCWATVGKGTGIRGSLDESMSNAPWFERFMVRFEGKTKHRVDNQSS
jgi:hypothetical protein